MQVDVPPSPAGDQGFWAQGLDREFYSRVYIRAAQLSTVLTILFLAFEQKAMAVGVTSGAAVGLFSMWTVEVMVRLLFQGGSHAGLKLALGSAVKMPFLLAGLVGIAWAGDAGHLNVFAVVGGVLLVHGVCLAMAVRLAMAHQNRVRERYQ